MNNYLQKQKWQIPKAYRWRTICMNKSCQVIVAVTTLMLANTVIAATTQGMVDEIQYLGNNRVTIKLNGVSCDPAGAYPRFSIYPDYPVGAGYVTVTPDGLDGMVSVALTALATGKTVNIQYMEAGVGNCYVDRIFIMKN